MSLVARLLARLRGRTLVGGDEHGNLYYKWVESISSQGADAASETISAGSEAPATALSVERRAVRTPSGSSPQKFDAATIPPEWSAWLRKTRREPPSPEEAAANTAQRERVRSLAAGIDQRRPPGGVGRAATAAVAAAAPGLPPLPTAAGEEEAPSVASSPPPPPRQQQQQQQQHSAMSGTFSAETWTPPPARSKEKKEGEGGEATQR